MILATVLFNISISFLMWVVATPNQKKTKPEDSTCTIKCSLEYMSPQVRKLGDTRKHLLSKRHHWLLMSSLGHVASKHPPVCPMGAQPFNYVIILYFIHYYLFILFTSKWDLECTPNFNAILYFFLSFSLSDPSTFSRK